MKLFLGNAILSIWVYSAISVNYSDDVYNEKLMISLERPQIIMEHPQVIHIHNITSRRPGRSDPHYYLHMCMNIFRTFNNSYSIYIGVTENRIAFYSVTYAVLHYKFCDFLKMLKFDFYYKEKITDPLVLTEVKFKNNKNDCTLVPGTYYFSNVILPGISFPRNFPLQKSRLNINLTNNYSETILRSQIDLELKAIPKRRRNN